VVDTSNFSFPFPGAANWENVCLGMEAAGDTKRLNIFPQSLKATNAPFIPHTEISS
jgi:hypothetical protein